MAWTPPKVWSQREELTAADMNLYVSDNLADLNSRLSGSGGYRFAGTRYYTASGTFEKADPLGTGDIGLLAIRVRMVGGGGGGGGSRTTTSTQISVGGPGGGGGYAEKFILVADLGASETVTVGEGGQGGLDASGSAGGASSFGTTVIFSALGGSGGTTELGGTPPDVSGDPGSGGGASGSFDFSVPGGSGDYIMNPVETQVVSASGGDSFLGHGAKGRLVTTKSDGNSTTNYGGGGSGALVTGGYSPYRGGSGGPGIVIIDCFV